MSFSERDAPGGIGGDDVSGEPVRRDEHREAVGGDPHFPWRVVNEPVVVWTEQAQVVQCRRSAVGPVDDVVRMTPGSRDLAGREGTVLVPEDQGAAHAHRYETSCPADVQRLGGTRKDSGDDHGISSEAAN